MVGLLMIGSIFFGIVFVVGKNFVLRFVVGIMVLCIFFNFKVFFLKIDLGFSFMYVEYLKCLSFFFY